MEVLYRLHAGIVADKLPEQHQETTEKSCAQEDEQEHFTGLYFPAFHELNAAEQFGMPKISSRDVIIDTKWSNKWTRE